MRDDLDKQTLKINFIVPGTCGFCNGDHGFHSSLSAPGHSTSATIETGEASSPVKRRGKAYILFICLVKIGPIFTSSNIKTGRIGYILPSSKVLWTGKFFCGPSLQISM